MRAVRDGRDIGRRGRQLLFTAAFEERLAQAIRDLPPGQASAAVVLEKARRTPLIMFRIRSPHSCIQARELHAAENPGSEPRDPSPGWLAGFVKRNGFHSVTVTDVPAVCCFKSIPFHFKNIFNISAHRKQQERMIPEDAVRTFMEKWKELIAMPGVRGELICNFDETMVEELRGKLKVVVPWETKKVVTAAIPEHTEHITLGLVRIIPFICSAHNHIPHSAVDLGRRESHQDAECDPAAEGATELRDTWP